MSSAEPAIRTVGLRILRDGPTHNHLLSPLTAYLAVVGPYEAVSLRMPYEHRRLVMNLNTLRYRAGPDRGPDATNVSRAERRIIADDVGAIFGAVPGLSTELRVEPACDGALTHLCLVFSAAELSLLPFELATAPRGFPGEGLPLSIQSVAPVVVTRAIPGATGRRCSWDVKPKILFVTAEPPGVAPVPVRAHLLALLDALRPWIGARLEVPSEDATRSTAVQEYLTVLTNATLERIEDECKRTRYTHVHILAHGETLEEGTQTQFALALHGRNGEKELVSSERLQAALRLPMGKRANDNELSHPLVASLATCDSGNQADVVFPAMSLAHALHAAGVPLVVGSLFPLSYAGSVVFAETLYQGLLRGRDPRRVLYDVRHALYRMDEQKHDWASIVAYASLPDDQALEEQVQGLEFRASRTGLKCAEALLKEMTSPVDSTEPDTSLPREHLVQIEKSIEKAAKALPVTGAYVLEGQGLLASSEKSRAEILWLLARRTPVATTEGARDAERLFVESRKKLVRARELYLQASRVPRWGVKRPGEELPTIHWVATQAVSLGVVLDGMLRWQEWRTANHDAENHLGGSGAVAAKVLGIDPLEVVWAHASKAELFLLAFGVPKDRQEYTDEDAPLPFDRIVLRKKALDHTKQHAELARLAGKADFVTSTARHIARYVNWWFRSDFPAARPDDAAWRAEIRSLAEEMLKLLKL